MSTGQRVSEKDLSDTFSRFLAVFTSPWLVSFHPRAQKLECRSQRKIDLPDPGYYTDNWYIIRSLGIYHQVLDPLISVASLAVEVSQEHIPLPALEESGEEDVRLDAIDFHVCEFRRGVLLQVHPHPTHTCFKIVCLADTSYGGKYTCQPPAGCPMVGHKLNTLAPYYIFIQVLEQHFEKSTMEWSFLLDKIDTQIGLEIVFDSPKLARSRFYFQMLQVLRIVHDIIMDQRLRWENWKEDWLQPFDCMASCILFHEPK
ncbi:hypothetical protein LTR24_010374 [Lithohypha guttulata]|uniref:Uncharacterized protein n=1 Tax=Lithohypha guttulata TaxID=1690604 RepID=A0ABR0JU46_9EURO|nr:hypothetical protein LTR24_010374 [Lithohypha guttulata]